ncbi:glutamate 5-kinase [Candidatus Laterigemmans baculatus]|uniref:glutamate 5-kinase n=1 Tax=Candidatus Laterigemmans baculatus TaxID=2770505 RepID=UPI0013DB7DAC|nr:glutamate 5-kinase [Candidatus Laterigemmans baculatus]
MADLRKRAINSARAVVVKVGTQVLTDKDGKLDRRRIDILASQLCLLAESGRQTVLVSSGAVGAGVAKLGLAERPQLLSKLQAVAAIGQADLIQAYERAFAPSSRHAAQVLLTAGDLRRRSGYLNVRNTLRQIHNLGAIAVVNENDSVGVAELRTTFGDNDRLAAAVASLFPEALLVILSDIDGLYDGPPGAEGSKVIDTVRRVDKSILELAVDKESGVSRGGMISKLRAARLATSHGHHTIIAAGSDDHVLEKILRGKKVGTLFVPGKRSVRGRRRWIGSTAEISGTLFVDKGACEAILSGGASLLAVGIRKVKGNFPRGAVVSICSLDGAEIARGLTHYRSEEIRSIRGVASEDIAKMLGNCPYESVVHRDNMAINEASRRPV